jgi:catechol 2,3-dioxygenase-like lactoylglutathione lyase family enzyme
LDEPGRPDWRGIHLEAGVASRQMDYNNQTEVYMASVQGIGGVFLDSIQAGRLARWYEETLGISMEAHPNGTDFYHVFSTRDAESGIQRDNPVFAVNQASEPLAERGRGFTLNLRVDNLDGFLEMLKGKGVELEGEVFVWEQGKHAWIRDADGNRLELYEEVVAG